MPMVNSTKLYHVRNWHGFRRCICRNNVQSNRRQVVKQWRQEPYSDMFVTFLLKTRFRSLMYVMSPSSSFALFLENLLRLSILVTNKHDATWRRGKYDALFVQLTDDSINCLFTRLVVCIY
jgi:hypothetical protein